MKTFQSLLSSRRPPKCPKGGCTLKTPLSEAEAWFLEADYRVTRAQRRIKRTDTRKT
jgi:hypothetical protein